MTTSFQPGASSEFNVQGRPPQLLSFEIESTAGDATNPRYRENESMREGWAVRRTCPSLTLTRSSWLRAHPPLAERQRLTQHSHGSSSLHICSNSLGREARVDWLSSRLRFSHSLGGNFSYPISCPGYGPRARSIFPHPGILSQTTTRVTLSMCNISCLESVNTTQVYRSRQ